MCIRDSDQAPLDEDVTNLGIHHQIDIAAAVSDLNIGEAMPFLGQWEEALGKKRHLLRKYGQFAGARSEQVSVNADEVANVEQLVKLEITFGKLVFLRIDLKLRSGIRKAQESGLAEGTTREDAPRHADFYGVVLQVLSGFVCDCLLYTSDAADERSSVDLGGR